MIVFKILCFIASLNIFSRITLVSSEITKYNNRFLTTLEWNTENNLSYMCSKKNISVTSGVSNSHLTCAQTEFPLTQGGSAGGSTTLTCDSGTIACFVFASYGKVGGSCAGDPFKEDPSGIWTYLPQSVGEAIIGKSEYTLSISEGSVIGGVAMTVDGAVASEETPLKLKVIAYCSGENSTSDNFGYYVRINVLILSIFYSLLF